MKTSWIWKLAMCTLMYVIATVLGGMLANLLGMRMPAALAGGDPSQALLQLLVASPMLAIALAPLIARLGGAWHLRAAAAFLLIYLGMTVNTMIELTIFSSVFQNGGMGSMMTQAILPALALSTAVAYWFRNNERSPGLPRFGATGWTWRVALAIVAFPVVYYTFGMMVGPFVAPHYTGGGPLGLVIPPQAVILRTQMLRSVLFLLASLPAVLLWTRSRRGLILALGFADAILLGIYGLSQASDVMPPILRILHSLEITADSFAYAAVLAWIFLPRTATAEATTPRFEPTAGVCA